jgi:hypothetical protein
MAAAAHLIKYLYNYISVGASTPSNTHPSIVPHFALKARLNNRKAPASPLTTRAGGAYQDGHPRRVKSDEGGREKPQESP